MTPLDPDTLRVVLAAFNAEAEALASVREALPDLADVIVEIDDQRAHTSAAYDEIRDGWHRERRAAAEARAEIARLSVTDDPIYDATDGAHPAWWRGHDHAAVKMREALDGARANALWLRAAVVEYLAAEIGCAAADRAVQAERGPEAFADELRRVHSAATVRLAAARAALRACVGQS